MNSQDLKRSLLNLPSKPSKADPKTFGNFADYGYQMIKSLMPNLLTPVPYGVQIVQPMSLPNGSTNIARQIIGYMARTLNIPDNTIFRIIKSSLYINGQLVDAMSDEDLDLESSIGAITGRDLVIYNTILADKLKTQFVFTFKELRTLHA